MSTSFKDSLAAIAKALTDHPSRFFNEGLTTEQIREQIRSIAKGEVPAEVEDEPEGKEVEDEPEGEEAEEEVLGSFAGKNSSISALVGARSSSSKARTSKYLSLARNSNSSSRSDNPIVNVFKQRNSKSEF